MERQRFMIAAGSAAAATLSAAVPSFAQTQSQPAGNESLRQTRANIAAIIDDLEFDPSVYGGHRIAAIEAFKAAHDELTQALKFRRKSTRTANVADTVIQDQINWIDNAIPALQNDNADYGGHKEHAVDSLKQARAELTAALNRR